VLEEEGEGMGLEERGLIFMVGILGKWIVCL
jgi:hypothetical protein